MAHNPLNEFKIQASILLKGLHSEDIDKALAATARFQSLPFFQNIELHKLKRKAKHKHALQVVALEQNFESWMYLKQTMQDIDLCPSYCGGFMNTWYTCYEKASLHLEAAKGYLLTYKKQFFICEADYIAALGLEPYSSDWQLIAYNWAKPVDPRAWLRLVHQLSIAAKKRRN